MLNNIDTTICEWDEAQFLFFSDNIWGDFIYYSHLLPAVSALVVTLFVYFNARSNKAAQALLVTGISFATWTFMDLFLWSSEKIDWIMFTWSSLIYFELFVYVGSLYFIYGYIRNKFPNFLSELAIVLSFIPLFLFGHTSLNLTGFDFTNCWREAIEGPLWQNYIYYLEAIFAAWIFIFALSEVRKPENTKRRKEFIIVTLGTLLFLFSFSIGNILGSVETDWEIGQIGLFGMPILLMFVGYAIVRFESFKLKVLTAEALFTTAFILLFSLLFVRTIENAQLIALGTLFIFSIIGFLLVRNIKREVQQKEQIEKLAHKLERANTKLQQMDKLKSEFVSIASHQLRSPITAISGYASLLREGSYGEITNKMREPIERIEQSARMMAVSIEDYLNVSRIEAGNMKYNLTDFSLADQAEHISDDLRPEALKRGLVLLFRKRIESKGIVNADTGKVQQIIHNLINNAIKYTQKGAITVYVHENLDTKKIYIDFLDTGVGMNTETLHSIFQKFERGDKANTVNVTGTGLGLYVAQKMAEAMHGTITAHSEGEGQGSRFTLELPLVM
ncbi:MAG: PAS/PAC sensor signal transduction histidine kinase [Parcubacteria group bacterium GW2011_GWF2_44_8]|nr:MAG: PAS/PAC sensor signal transduction histidine kinase [Parcubacteria group bacterium GW2011_GWF2_44_8]